MSEMAGQTGGSLAMTERRQHSRLQAKSLAYLDIGPDNGGIVLNLSEGGIAVQAAGPLSEEPLIGLRIQLPNSVKKLVASGKIAWRSESKKEAGLEFADLPEAARLQIREWLSSESPPQELQVNAAIQPETTLPPKGKRTEKWTSLVAEQLAQGGANFTHRDNGVAAASPSAASLSRSDEVKALAPSPEAVQAPSSPVAAEKKTEALMGSTFVAPVESKPVETHGKVSAGPEPAFAPPVVPFETSKPGDASSGKKSVEPTLPSDRLLRRRAGPRAIASDSIQKLQTPPGPQAVEKSKASSSSTDEFVVKARSNFAAKHLVNSKPAGADSLSILGSQREVTADTDAGNGTAKADTSAAQSQPATPTIKPGELAPVTVLASPTLAPKTVTDPSRADLHERLSPGMTASGDQHRSLTSIVVMCVIIVVVCAGLGIALGRRTFRTASSSAASGDGASQAEVPRVAALPKTTSASKSSASPSSAGTRGAVRTSTRTTHVPMPRDASPPLHESKNQIPISSPLPPVNEQPSTTPPANYSSSVAAATTPATSHHMAVQVYPSSPLAPSAGNSRLDMPPAVKAPHRTEGSLDRTVPAHLVYRVEPFYPREAMLQHVEGTVKIHLTVGQDGKVKNLNIVSGPSLLTSAALDAAQYWRYIPALHNGNPVESEADILIEFHSSH